MERLAEARDERLRPGVRRVEGRRLVAGERRHIDDPAPSPLDHRRQRGVRELHDRQHVETDYPCLGLSRELGELAEGPHTGVVDEEVDRRLGGLEPRLDHRHPLLRDQVGGEDLDCGAVLLLELLRELLEPGLVASDDHEVVAACCERARERGADARRSAGDERYRLAHGHVATSRFTGRARPPPRRAWGRPPARRRPRRWRAAGPSVRDP